MTEPAVRATFAIGSSFQISGRGVVLGGEVRSGIVKVGMRARLVLDDGSVLEAPVKGVEFIDCGGERRGEADIGLVLREDDLEMKQRWKTLGPGRMLEICDA